VPLPLWVMVDTSLGVPRKPGVATVPANAAAASIPTTVPEPAANVTVRGPRIALESGSASRTRTWPVPSLRAMPGLPAPLKSPATMLP